MSMTTALASAFSGLSAAARQADVLSSNIANAATPGYARHEVALSASVIGGTGQGVQVDGIRRRTDPWLVNDRRLAEAGSTATDARTAFLKAVEDLVGDPASGGSLTARVAAFDAALVEAAGRPESGARLTAAAEAARALSGALNTASRGIQDQRRKADSAIAAAVETLNAGLKRVERLNAEIVAATGAGRDVAPLLDQRARAIDTIAAHVPLREVPREHGRVALVSASGAILLDGKAPRLDFRASPALSAESTMAGGALSGLTLNGRAIATTGAGALAGGGLESLFQIRDDLAVTAQARLDGVARDLIARFSDPALDPTLEDGAPGLFTDAGRAFDALRETGVAGRIALNAAVDTDHGGRATRLRDGLHATASGPPGDAGLLVALSGRLGAARETLSPALPPGQRSFPELAADLLSLAASGRVTAETDQGFAAARLAALQDLEAGVSGVDIDGEMQALLVVEKSYAANARVLRALDDMLNRLMEI